MMSKLSYKDRRKVSLFLNILIVGLEIISFVILLLSINTIPLQYFTVDSNILALVTCAIFIYYIVRDEEIPYWLRLMKYISAVCLTITFLVVVFVLAPMYEWNYGYLLFHNELLYQHLLCPVFFVLAFLLFDNFAPEDFDEEAEAAKVKSIPRKLMRFRDQKFQYTYKLQPTDDVYPVGTVLLYGIVLVILNLVDVVSGPYPFLRIKEQPIWASILWFALILGSTYVVSIALRKFRNHK